MTATTLLPQAASVKLDLRLTHQATEPTSIDLLDKVLTGRRDLAMGLRVRLVEPRPAGHNVYDLAHLPRLGLPLMARMLADGGHDARVFCEVLSPVDLGECLGADLVGISSTTATAPAAYRLADLLGAAGVAVVLGGPHVSFRVDEALAHAPYVVRGEGEQTMLALAGALDTGRGPEEIRGLSFCSERGAPCHNPPRRRCSQAEFEALPCPDLSLIEGHHLMGTKPIMTQWGCPFDCEFCSVTATFSRAVRHRRPDQVLAELAFLDTRRVFFYDDNFVVNKARTTRLLQGMLDTGLTPTWFAQLRADAALTSRARPEVDHDFLALMRRSGAAMVMVGVEATTDEALAAVGKRQSVSTVETAVRGFHDHDIAVHGMFVAGLDTDSPGSARATADFARRLGIDTFQLMMETPLPGTRLFERVSAAGRILSEDWSLFDGHHAVMAPARMSALELQLEVLQAMKQFYSWSSIVSSGLAGALGRLPHLPGAPRPAASRHLPALARAAWARHWEDIVPLLSTALPRGARARVGSALWLPALRLYARRQLAAWCRQDRSRAHLDWLASLA